MNSDEVWIMNDKWTTLIRRGLVVWVVIIIVEMSHGMVRQIVLEPLIGDFRARQVSVLVGSALIIGITFIFVRWLKGSSVFDFVLIGILWVGLTVGFEIVLGRFAMNLSWERIAFRLQRCRRRSYAVGVTRDACGAAHVCETLR